MNPDFEPIDFFSRTFLLGQVFNTIVKPMFLSLKKKMVGVQFFSGC